MSQYYYLIASLPELTLDDNKRSRTGGADLKEELYACLSGRDKELVNLFYLQYDNRNLLLLLQNKDAVIDKRGNYTAEELLERIAEVKEGSRPDPRQFPAYLTAFLEEEDREEPAEPHDTTRLPENRLAAHYYAYGMSCKNEFVSAWFAFNLGLNNLLAALAARKYKIDPAHVVVGDTEVCEALRTSGARDFGLSAEWEYAERILKIAETENLLEREKKIDQLKWDWLEENGFFHYFTVERLYTFLLQSEMIERRTALDKEKGQEMFRRLIDSLKSEVRVPDEFIK